MFRQGEEAQSFYVLVDGRLKVTQVTPEGQQVVVRLMLRLAEQASKPAGRGIRIDFPISRQGVAEITGTTLHTVSRTLSSWRSRASSKAVGRRSRSGSLTPCLQSRRTNRRRRRDSASSRPDKDGRNPRHHLRGTSERGRRDPLGRARAGALSQAATSMIIVIPPPPWTSAPLFVTWWLMWQWSSHLPGLCAVQRTS